MRTGGFGFNQQFGFSAPAVSAVAAAPAEIPFSAVVLLSGFEGPDLSTTLDDESNSNHTLTANGDAKIVTAAIRYGASSLSLAVSSTDYVSSADSADFNFGAGAFTIEGWFYSQATGARYLIRQYETGDLGWRLLRTATNITLGGSSDGTTPVTLATAAWTATPDTWQHIAADFDGTTYRIYVDGVMVASGTSTITLFDSTADLRIGSTIGATAGFVGHVDEVRITKGYARYASDDGFTPPTEAFPRS